ncbi:hypothetical protein BDQ12DRAFT_720259 [Crucibulum laeve]|uniref:Uncharacterized protein n=1 Tax=Crucibulum laeve TaxID=68775 RepID=A0A5C3MC09_9AGAR|nr:hypothetical protein BDQ12DRAFT_720259 [Crucibulum laeve]
MLTLSNSQLLRTHLLPGRKLASLTAKVPSINFDAIFGCNFQQYARDPFPEHLVCMEGELTDLVTSILDQLIAHFPDISDDVHRLLAFDNSAILCENADVQMWKLLVEPILDHYGARNTTVVTDIVQIPYTAQCFSSPNERPPRPSVVIIDGLESYDSDEVAHLIATLCEAGSSKKLPLKFLFVSTTSANTQEVYEEQSESPGLVLTASLHGAFNPENDIRIYLRTCFERIYKHKLSKHPIPKPWPEDTFIETVVLHSSKQFCYASAIVKFINGFYDPRKGVVALQNIYAPPTISPEASVSSTETKRSPFEQLNKRYIRILREAKEEMDGRNGNGDLPQVRITLGLVVAMLDCNEIPTAEIIDNLSGVREGMTERVLSNLQSLLHVADHTENPRYRIDIHHADFVEFLLDPERSPASYHLDIEKYHAAMTIHCLLFLGRRQKHEDMKISKPGIQFLRRLEYLRTSLSLPAIGVLLSLGDDNSYSHLSALFHHFASLPGDPLMCATTREHLFKFTSTSNADMYMYSDPGKDYSYLTLCCLKLVVARYKMIMHGVNRMKGCLFVGASDFTPARNGVPADRLNSIDWKVYEKILFDSASPAKPIPDDFMCEALDHATSQWPTYLSRSSPTMELQEWIINNVKYVEIIRDVDVANGRDTFKTWATEHCRKLSQELRKPMKDDKSKEKCRMIGELAKKFQRIWQKFP